MVYEPNEYHQKEKKKLENRDYSPYSVGSVVGCHTIN